MLLGKARFDYSRGFASKLIALNRDQFLTHTPLLFNAFPLTRVNILSAIRDRDRRGVMGDLRWQLIRSELGAVLKDRLPAPKFSLRSLMGYYDGDSYEQLEAIVSNVCVTYGRERVGLPPLSQ